MIRRFLAPVMERARVWKLCRLAAAREGATAVEFAIILPAMLMLLLGIMETGRGLWTQNALNYAVEQAARCAAIDKINCGSATQIQAYAATVAGTNFGSATFTYAVAQCGSQVSASYPVQLQIPYLPAPALTLTAQSCFP